MGGALESGDALIEGVNAVIQFRAHQTNNGDLQNDGLVGRTLHFSHRTPNGLEGAHRARESQRLAPLRQTLSIITGHVSHVSGHLEQEGLTDFSSEVLCQLFGVPAIVRK